jgi:hypothetical protein
MLPIVETIAQNDPIEGYKDLKAKAKDVECSEIKREIASRFKCLLS